MDFQQLARVAGRFLCCHGKLVLFHGRQDAEVTLQAFGVVVEDVLLNHLYERFPVSKAPAVVAFALEDAPKALHRTVVNTLGYTGHALCHSGFLQFCMEGAVGILKSSVAME